MSLALWCVFVAGLMPMISVAFSRGGDIDNHAPRDSSARLTGYRRRAFAAHLNAYEFFPLFAAAVLVAQGQGVRQPLVDGIAAFVVAARLVYLGCYLADLSTPRSAVFGLGWLGALAIFTSPVWAG